MKSSIAALAATLLLALPAAHASGTVPDNPAIDAAGHLRDTQAALELRRTRRVTEEEFIRMSREPGTIVLDARSPWRFAQLRVKGAVNLSFSDFTAESLREVLGNTQTRVLIYCNNNFFGAEAFPTKALSASLNVPTFTALYSYGYHNVYELGPFLDVRGTRLEFAGSRVGADGKVTAR